MRTKYYYMQDYQDHVQKCTAKEAKPKKSIWIYLIKVQKQEKESPGIGNWDSGYPWGARALKNTKHTMIYY